MTDTWERVAGNLQQQIGQLAARYEGEMAVLRANVAQQLEAKEAEITALRKQLEESGSDVSEAPGTSTHTA